MFSSVKEPYDNLPKLLNSAITKLFTTSLGMLKTEEMQKLQKFHIFSDF